eukprot:264511-Pyramimonas_sp.AAC.1
MGSHCAAGSVHQSFSPSLAYRTHGAEGLPFERVAESPRHGKLATVSRMIQPCGFEDSFQNTYVQRLNRTFFEPSVYLGSGSLQVARLPFFWPPSQLQNATYVLQFP